MLARPVQRIYRLRQPLDTAALLRAFRHVVADHPALRLRLIPPGDGAGWRQRFPTILAGIAGMTIVGKTPEVRAAYARHVFAQDAAATMDLREQAPFLARVVELDGEHYFGLCLDHMAADDLATDVLLRELSAAYLRERQGQPHPPSGREAAFFDCLTRELKQRARESENLAYWRDHLAQALLDRQSDGELQWVPGTHQRWHLEREGCAALGRACRARQCSLFAAVLAAQVRLLSALLSEDDLVINIPVSNRVMPADHGVIANLSMLLHLRFRGTRLTPPQPFLTQVRDQILEAMQRRQVDYGALSEAVTKDAATRGGHVSWLVGCSYLIERQGETADDPLWAERMDDDPQQPCHAPRGSWTLTCRQGTKGLAFQADWDAGSWAIEGPALRHRYLAILSELTDTPLHQLVAT